MKRIFALLACAGALAVAGCTSDSKLPNPTGKGSIRAINAIPASPDVTFLIEERGLGVVAYKGSSAPAQYDDFDYVFSFDVSIPGVVGPQRIASVPHKVEAGKEHVFLLTGTVSAPQVSVITTDIRSFADTDTVFEISLLHAAASLGDVDVYIDPVGTPPSPGTARATLAAGDILPAVDLEQGGYVVTVTASGDINTVLYQSREESFAARSALLLTLFDGDANETAPLALTSMTSLGAGRNFPDARFPSTVRFIHASRDLGTADIYDDEALTSLVVADHAFGTFTGDIATGTDAVRYRYTPASSTGSILFESNFTPPSGRHANFFVYGLPGEYFATSFVPDRASVSEYVKLRLFSAATDNRLVDLYLKAAGEPLEETDLPRLIAIPYSLPTGIANIQAGSYDIYITGRGDKVVLGGPFGVDVVNGDVLDLVLLDTADPNILDILEVPVP